MNRSQKRLHDISIYGKDNKLALETANEDIGDDELCPPRKVGKISTTLLGGRLTYFCLQLIKLSTHHTLEPSNRRPLFQALEQDYPALALNRSECSKWLWKSQIVIGP